METLKRLLAWALVKSSWLWLPAATLLVVGAATLGTPFASISMLACYVGGFFLLCADDARRWMFTHRVTHFAFPPCAGVLVFASTSYGMRTATVEATLFGLVATAAGGGLSWALRDVSIVPVVDPDADPNFVRGVRRMRVERAKANAASATRAGEETLVFGPIRLPLPFVHNNFLVIGAPGSGKTALSYLTMASFLKLITPGSGKRAVIYDAKTETVSRLTALGYAGEVIITNFTDARASAWQIGEDFCDPHTIAEAAELFFPVPTSGQSQVFFDYAVRDLAQGVMLSWNTRFPGCLTLRDLINSMESEVRLRQVLSWNMEANHARLELYFGQRDTLQSILATIASKVEPYRAIAAFWSNAPHRFSLREFTRREAVLVLGRPMEAQTAADTLNSLLIARLAQIALDEENTEETRTFVFLDEVGKAGRLRFLDMLLLQGRSKGVRVWLAAQSIASLRATYGADIAADLTAGCGNVAVLALAEPVSAQWAEETWSRQERWDRSSGTSRTSGPQGTSVTSSENFNLVVKPTVLASEFLAMRPPSKRTGEALGGFYRLPGIGSFAADIELAELAKSIPDTTGQVVGPNVSPDHIRAPRHHGAHRRWSEDELRLLGLPADNARLPASDGWSSESDGRPWRKRPAATRPASPRLDDIPNLFGKKKGR